MQPAWVSEDPEIHRDFDTVLQLARELTVRYTEGLESVTEDGDAVLEKQAAKRVAIRFVPERVASWDHGKLGGTY